MSKNVDRSGRPFPWKCGHCRARAVQPAVVDYSTEVAHDGRLYTVRVPALRTPRCQNCGTLVLDTRGNERISRAFRRQAHLLSPSEIRRERRALRLTQEQLAARLGV